MGKTISYQSYLMGLKASHLERHRSAQSLSIDFNHSTLIL
jgi:hypothetical protein